jgi:hypothetical protein
MGHSKVILNPFSTASASALSLGGYPLQPAS